MQKKIEHEKSMQKVSSGWGITMSKCNKQSTAELVRG